MILSCVYVVATAVGMAERPQVDVEFRLEVAPFRDAFHEPPADNPTAPDEFGRPLLTQYQENVEEFLTESLQREFPFLDFTPTDTPRYRLELVLQPWQGSEAATVETGFRVSWLRVSDQARFSEHVWWTFRRAEEIGRSTARFEEETLNRLGDYLPSRSRDLHETLLQYVPLAERVFVLMEDAPNVFCVLRHGLEELGLDLGSKFRVERTVAHPVLGNQLQEHVLAARAPKPGDAAPVTDDYREGIVAEVEEGADDYQGLSSGEIEVQVYVQDYVKSGRRLLQRRRDDG